MFPQSCVDGVGWLVVRLGCCCLGGEASDIECSKPGEARRQETSPRQQMRAQLLSLSLLRKKSLLICLFFAFDSLSSRKGFQFVATVLFEER